MHHGHWVNLDVIITFASNNNPHINISSTRNHLEPFWFKRQFSSDSRRRNPNLASSREAMVACVRHLDENLEVGGGGALPPHIGAPSTDPSTMGQTDVIPWDTAITLLFDAGFDPQDMEWMQAFTSACEDQGGNLADGVPQNALSLFLLTWAGVEWPPKAAHQAADEEVQLAEDVTTHAEPVEHQASSSDMKEPHAQLSITAQGISTTDTILPVPFERFFPKGSDAQISNMVEVLVGKGMDVVFAYELAIKCVQDGFGPDEKSNGKKGRAAKGDVTNKNDALRAKKEDGGRSEELDPAADTASVKVGASRHSPGPGETKKAAQTARRARKKAKG